MILLYQEYTSDNPERQSELERAKLLRESMSMVSKIIALDGNAKRLTYRHFFDFANTNFPNETIVVVNSDIVPLELNLLSNNLIQENDFWAVTRWERKSMTPSFEGRVVNNTFYSHSQDVWMFRTPIKDFFCDFELGQIGCDNRIAFEASNAGYRVINPALSIKCYHIHETGHRTYTEAGQYLGPKLFPAIGCISSNPDFIIEI